MSHHLPPPADPSLIPSDLVDAAETFVPDATGMAPVAERQHLVRVDAPSGIWRVRRWPPSSTRRQIDFVHRLLATLQQAGIDFVPTIAPLPEASEDDAVLVLNGRYYDAQRWLPGVPAGRSLIGWHPTTPTIDLPTVIAESAVTPLVEAIARTHIASEELARSPRVPAVSLPDVVTAVQRAWGAQRERLRPVAPRRPPVQRWLALGERALPAVLAALEPALAPEMEERSGETVLHLGLWPSHIVLDDSSRSQDASQTSRVGLIGWEGAAVGSPLLDLAQVITRCQGWSAANAERTLATYATLRPLSPEERRLLPAIAALDLVATAGYLLDRAYVPTGDQDAAPPTALRVGADALITSLETVTTLLTRGDSRRGAKGRAWTHRPRGGSGKPIFPPRPEPGSRPPSRRRPARPR